MGLFGRNRTEPAPLGGDIRAIRTNRGAECLVRLSGRVTIDSSPELRDWLMERLNAPDCQTLTVDFYDVSYIDTSGLAILVEILKCARGRGKTLSLSGLRERPRYLLEATHLLHLFHEVAHDAI